MSLFALHPCESCPKRASTYGKVTDMCCTARKSATCMHSSLTAHHHHTIDATCVCRLTDTCYTAQKLKKGQWVSCTLRVTNTAIERLDGQSQVPPWISLSRIC